VANLDLTKTAIKFELSDEMTVVSNKSGEIGGF
jgi:hypothetical protein